MFGAILRPWRTTQTWWSLTHLILNMPVGVVGFVLTFPLAVASVSLIVVVPAAIVVSAAAFLVAHRVAHVERGRVRALLGVEVHDQARALEGRPWERYKQMISSKPRWKELGYLLTGTIHGSLTMSITVVAWCGSVALAFLPAYLPALPGDVARFGLFDVHQGWEAAGAALLGVLGLLVGAPWITVGLANADRFWARAMLGKPERAELEERVSELETSRSAAVDTAEAERRRIERDLHDGAQQRLIAVAMDLGRARVQLDDDPTSAGALVTGAHEEVKAAIKELRDLVRGFHPVILEDRGLDAALSAVVARAPIPVSLAVKVDPRPQPAIESAAYFIVSEALTNVARHAEATSASVEIARRGDRLTIAITDNGRGGADATRGTGLAGLHERVAALGGWMQVVSPVGGPTTLLAEVPCG